MTHDGQVQWILGGAKSTFTSGDALSWNVQHGHHLLAPDRLLMFENGAPGAGSMAYEIVLDEGAKSANRVWQYDGGASTPVLGDVQRLPNGNTLVTYSIDGAMHEVEPDEQLVQSITWEQGGSVCDSQRRSSLYGPPPRL